MPDFVPTFDPQPSRPQLALPAGACDAHVHVFGPVARFPFAPESPLRPGDAPKETLFALHRQLGVERCVIVQSLVHGLDNSAVEDAVAAGGGRYLGVALVALEVSEVELKRLADAGFRGVRFNFMSAEQASTAGQVIALTRRLAPLGLHLQVQLEGRLIGDLAPLLKQSAVPVVIDHMARLDAALGVDQPGFRVLCRLLEDPRFHVKVSGADRLSPPPYAAGAALARGLVDNFPDRCFWGTDWPHPFHDHVPDDGVLVDLLAGIAPTAAARQALLVDNPQRFYRFEDLPPR